jgi:hypothetical protein
MNSAAPSRAVDMFCGEVGDPSAPAAACATASESQMSKNSTSAPSRLASLLEYFCRARDVLPRCGGRAKCADGAAGDEHAHRRKA